MMRSLRIVSHNVNHTPAQTHFVLESLVGECDILLVQEPYYGPIKTIASSTDPAGDVLTGTQVHAAWQLIETGESARVCVYVNRELGDLRPQICSHVVDHRDIILVSIRIDGQVHHVMNVYNDEHCTALSWLLDHAEQIPPLDLVAGDFNLHSTQWEPDAPRESARATELVNLMAGWGLCLANADGVPTHRPHNTALRSTTPDLLWAPADRVARGEVQVKINLEGRGLSDHALLCASFPVGWWEKILPKNIKRGSKEEKSFIRDLCDEVVTVPAQVGTVEELQRTCDTVLAAVQRVWEEHAVHPKVSSRSKQWWNAECTEARDAFRAARTDENRAAFKRATKAAKNKYFDDRIAATCEK
ncbi:Endonuclease/exonuclease/phosphatase, partial [Epithele typhae]|uniref:Endonuclease/exonuclease/phosphatase n=1 Tax=Epithele typhae TaxID=378194 RepID=UPI002008BAFA